MAWIPALGVTTIFGKIYFDSYQLIYREIRAKYEEHGEENSTPLQVTLVKPQRSHSSAGYVLDGPDINKAVMHIAGGVIALSTLVLTHGTLYTALRKMMLTPTQNLRRQKLLLTQVMEATPPPLPLTPPRMWRMLGPSSTPHTVRRFWRLYGNLLFFHWLSFTLAVTIAAGTQSIAEAMLFGIHGDYHALTRRDRDRLQQAAARAAARQSMLQEQSALRMAELQGAADGNSR